MSSFYVRCMRLKLTRNHSFKGRFQQFLSGIVSQNLGFKGEMLGIIPIIMSLILWNVTEYQFDQICNGRFS